jgi:hypothetical protein
MSDQHGPLIAAQHLVQGDRIGGQRAHRVAAVCWNCRRRVAALERRDRAEAGCRQVGQQVAPCVRGIGEAVQAQGQRPGPAGL